MKGLLILSLVAPVAILVYPFISFVRYKFFNKPIGKSEYFLAPVSILIACYNEEKFIRNKILSFLDADEWIDGSEIIVISAGSTDLTNTVLTEFQNNPAIRIIISQDQISKIRAINMGIDYARHEILVFSDCRQKMKKGSLKQIVHNFSNYEIGTVTAVLNDPNKKNRQSFLRKSINTLVYLDSRSGSGFNVYGALYAQRKSIFRKFPQDQLFDDLYVIISTLSQKKRLIQEPKAVLYDVNFYDYYKSERLERLTRGLLLFMNQWELLMKINKGDLIRFLIFKYAKLLLPFSLLIWTICLINYLFLTDNNLVKFAALFLLFLCIAIKQSRTFMLLILRINFYFFLAIFKFFLLGKQSNRWEKLRLYDGKRNN